MKNKSYKFRFYPTTEQIIQLNIEFNNARFVYNQALAMRKKAYERRGENLNYVTLGKHFAKLKKTDGYAWLKKSTTAVLTCKLIDLETAFKNFFQHGSQFPVFKKRNHAESIRYQMDQRIINNIYKSGDFIKITKLGEVNIRWSRIPKGIPKMATVSRTSSGKYFITFSCEEETEILPKTGKSVGIDIGVHDVIYTSDNFASGSPQYYSKYQKDLRQANKALSLKTKGSKRWHKQRIHLARIHEKAANCRKDFLNKLTTKIVKEYDNIYIEDLEVKSMCENTHSNISKAILDVGIFELTRQLIYKADWYGKTVIKIDKWFPSTKTCSSCGQIHKMKLTDRMMNCDCGLSLNRDHNASLNILAAGRAAHRETEIIPVA